MRILIAAFLITLFLAGCAGLGDESVLTVPGAQSRPTQTEPSKTIAEPPATATGEPGPTQPAMETPVQVTQESEQPTAAAPDTAASESVEPSSPREQLDCVNGYVLEGGDITPPGLTDAPRSFQYLVQQDNGQEIMVGYMSFPPSPAGDGLGPNLSFFNGTIQEGDYLEACGYFDASINMLLVTEADHYLKTFRSQLDSGETAKPSAEPVATGDLETAQPTPEQSDIVCVSGYVLDGGDLTPSGLSDTPRTFTYAVEQADGEEIIITYTAYPPSPAGDQLEPQLNFHQGTIEAGDYLEACGSYDAATDILNVEGPDNSITTYATSRFLLVRHAERASTETNSDLADPAGLNRAAVLADIAVDTGVEAAYATWFCRTAQTAQPSAQTLGLPLNLRPLIAVGAGVDQCNPAITVPVQGLPGPTTSADTFAHFLLQNHPPGQTVLIVGHSDTTPSMVEALSGRSPCPDPLPLDANDQCYIQSTTFDLLFVVQVAAEADFGLVEMIEYGA